MNSRIQIAMPEIPGEHKETAKRIASLANAKRLNQSDVARLVGVTRANVSAWFRGIYKPEGDNLWKLAEVLGCSPGYLLDYSEPERGIVEFEEVSLALEQAKSAHAKLGRAIKILEEARLRSEGADFSWKIKGLNPDSEG